MGAPKGNKYWQFRHKHGRDFQYTPESLEIEIVNYLEWLEENPLFEEKVFAFQGTITTHKSPKMRAPTIGGFCIFADISFQTFDNYRKNKDFVEVVTRIEAILKAYKFEGAAAELLNPNIIARDLALGENLDVKSGGDKITPNIVVSTDAAKTEIEKLINDSN